MENEIKKCPKCGAEIATSATFCPACGKKLSSEKKNVNLKLLIIIAAICAVVIGGVVTAVLIINAPINQFKGALTSHNIKYAVSIYGKNASDINFASDAATAVSLYIDEQKNKIAIGESEPDALLNECEGLAGIYSVDETAEFADSIKKSKHSYLAAVDLMNNSEYLTAIDSFKQVSAEDVQYYASAQENIKLCTDNFCNSKINESENYVSENNFDDAVKALEEIKKSGFMEDSIDDKIADVLQQKHDYISSEAISKAAAKDSPIEAYQELVSVNEQYRNEEIKNAITTKRAETISFIENEFNTKYNKSEFVEAYNYIVGLPSEISKFSEITKLKDKATDSFVDETLASAKSLADAGKYQEAVDVLDGAIKQISHFKLRNAKADYQEQLDINFLKSVKNKLYVKYDSIDKKYWVDIYPTKYWDDFYSVHARPELCIPSSSSPYIGIDFGFGRSSWIFMDDIIIDCDGKQTKFSVGHFERDTEVDRGSIYETWWVTHSKRSISGQRQNLQPLIENMEKASVVQIRFVGDNGKADYTISSDNVSKICTLWRVYQIIENKPELAKYITG